MGPRPFDRGRPRRCPSRRRRVPCFNGSTAFRPWETTVGDVLDRAATELQWVHGLSTVGDAIGAFSPSARPEASMGPRPFDRGRRPRHLLQYGPRCGFNGSTAFRPWETREGYALALES